MGYIHPAERMIGILFTQCMMDSQKPPRVFTAFWTLAYAAMDEAGHRELRGESSWNHVGGRIAVSTFS